MSVLQPFGRLSTHEYATREGLVGGLQLSLPFEHRRPRLPEERVHLPNLPAIQVLEDGLGVEHEVGLVHPDPQVAKIVRVPWVVLEGMGALFEQRQQLVACDARLAMPADILDPHAEWVLTRILACRSQARLKGLPLGSLIWQGRHPFLQTCAECRSLAALTDGRCVLF